MSRKCNEWIEEAMLQRGYTKERIKATRAQKSKNVQLASGATVEKQTNKRLAYGSKTTATDERSGAPMRGVGTLLP